MSYYANEVRSFHLFLKQDYYKAVAALTSKYWNLIFNKIFEDIDFILETRPTVSHLSTKDIYKTQ